MRLPGILEYENMTNRYTFDNNIYTEEALNFWKKL